MLWPARLVCRALRARACGKLLHPALGAPHLCRALASLPAPELSLREWRRRQKVVVVTGPTAVGKTAVSLALAELLDGEVISADSVQVYKGLDIGSDKVDLLSLFLAVLGSCYCQTFTHAFSLHLGRTKGVSSCAGQPVYQQPSFWGAAGACGRAPRHPAPLDRRARAAPGLLCRRLL